MTPRVVHSLSIARACRHNPKSCEHDPDAVKSCRDTQPNDRRHTHPSPRTPEANPSGPYVHEPNRRQTQKTPHRAPVGPFLTHAKRATRLHGGDMGRDGELARHCMRTLGVSDDDSGREKLRPVRHETRGRPRVVDGAVKHRGAQLLGLEVRVRDGRLDRRKYPAQRCRRHS